MKKPERLDPLGFLSERALLFAVSTNGGKGPWGFVLAAPTNLLPLQILLPNASRYSITYSASKRSIAITSLVEDLSDQYYALVAWAAYNMSNYVITTARKGCILMGVAHIFEWVCPLGIGQWVQTKCSNVYVGIQPCVIALPGLTWRALPVSLR